MSRSAPQQEPSEGTPATGEEVLESLSQFSRGDRALSLLDQIQRGTLDLEMAAWLAAQVAAGASFIVGARPGRAGKTTTMRALLSFAPRHLSFVEALPGRVGGLDGKPSCVISHELSSHGLPAYLWGQDVRDFYALPQEGHMVVANLHADDLEETRGQICDDNGVSAAQFRSVALYIFLRVEGEGEEGRRWIEEVAHSSGKRNHHTVFTRAGGLSPAAPRDPGRESAMGAFLASAMADGECTPPELRRRFLQSDLSP